MSFDIRINPNAIEEWWQWKKEACAKIGYTGNEYLFVGGDGPWDFAWNKGSLYMRSSQKGLFCWSWAVNEEAEKIVPSVICGCGGEVFELRYGDYEVLARCGWKKQSWAADG